MPYIMAVALRASNNSTVMVVCLERPVSLLIMAAVLGTSSNVAQRGRASYIVQHCMSSARSADIHTNTMMSGDVMLPEESVLT